METLRFKTNIKCGGCVATVTPYLNQENTIQNWRVDTNTTDKILTVAGEDVNPQQVKNLLQKAGFKADLLQVAGTGGTDL